MDGLANWANARLERWRSKRAAIELEEFLQPIRGFGLNELGLLAAQTARVAGQYFEAGIDLRNLGIADEKLAALEWELTELAIRLRKGGKEFHAPGFMVWAHTCRAAARPALLLSAKEMWAHIAEGFAHAGEAAEGVAMVTGQPIPFDPQFLQVPVGFEARQVSTSPLLPPVFFFKSGTGAFEIHCEYGKIEPLEPRRVRLAIVEPTGAHTMADGRQWVWARIADPEKAFVVRALTVTATTPPLRGGELVQWLAVRIEPRLSKVPELSGDPRGCWQGLIVALFAPEMATATGQFRVLADYSEHIPPDALPNRN